MMPVVARSMDAQHARIAIEGRRPGRPLLPAAAWAAIRAPTVLGMLECPIFYEWAKRKLPKYGWLRGLLDFRLDPASLRRMSDEAIFSHIYAYSQETRAEDISDVRGLMVQFQGHRRSIKPGVAMTALVHAAVGFLKAALQRGFAVPLPQDLLRLASVGADGACDISEESLLATVCEAVTSEPLGIETDLAFFRVVNAYPERRDKLVADHQCAARSLVHVCLYESLGMVGGGAHQVRASTSDFVALDLQRWCSISVLPRACQAHMKKSGRKSRSCRSGSTSP